MLHENADSQLWVNALDEEVTVMQEKSNTGRVKGRHGGHFTPMVPLETKTAGGEA